MTRNWVDAVSPREDGAQRRHVVAGERLVRRRDAGLHLLRPCPGAISVDGLGLELDLPAARRRAGQFDFVGRRAAGVGDDRPGWWSACRPRRAPLTRPSRPESESRGWPTISSVTSVLAVASSADTRDRDRIRAGIDGRRRTHLELHVLGLAGLDRDRGQFLGAVGLGERGLEIAAARVAAKLTVRLRPESFLIVS